MDDPAFGARLRRLRHAVGLTIEELSSASGVSERTIGNMERGTSRRPQRATVGLLADALGLTGAGRDELLAAARAGRRSPVEVASALLAMPRGVVDFTGREAERALLADMVPDGPAGTAAVAVVSGPPGVGKTSLVVRAAVELAARFPDGQLFVDLRGLDARPLDPALALERLITALDAGHGPIPSDLAGRTALYRSLAAARRAVVVLDNAADEAQVRPLLPATGAGLTLVTSRRLLTGLEGVRRVRLDPLPAADADRLLLNLIAERPDTGPTADAEIDPADRAVVAELSRLCGNLPLALRIVGNRLALRPDWTPARLLSRLGDAGRRLPALVAGDLEVSAAFRLSYAQLSDGARRLLRRLALVPGPDTGPALAAALTGEPVEATEDALDELVELGLLQSGFTGRYRLHDLMRLYAADRLDEEETAADRSAAHDRAVDWLLDTAIVAGRWFEPEFGGTPGGWAGAAGLDTEQRAERWLRAEADNWLAALEDAAAAGRHRKVLAVAEAMHWFSDRWIHWGHWPRVFTLSSRAGLHLGDDGAAATHLNYLSWACGSCLGDAAAAAACARHAHRRAVAAADPRQQGWARSYLATALLASGDPAAALVSARQAAGLFREAGDREGLPHALALAGRSLERTGRLDAALRTFRERLVAVCDPATAPVAQVAAITRVSALFDIGRLHMRRDEWAEAVAALETALASDVAGAIPQWQAAMYVALGEARGRLGSTAAAQDELRRAEAVRRRIGEGEHAARTREWQDRLRPLPAGGG
ncbi:ATP-binding protein [Pseudonocardia humida]|uniref:Helix-turn-helix domain-containing protein n=1 Tax=Pseudonocardia humida TaxID=2800819 RepID=A0ABT1A1H4_9PSEU|nr:helix-turn-helix domain-containing protein [Pseudonocardia humida]MCO1656778.1 helix-turn-helix domain-containing protein [Pseudonocardia humida]